MFSDDDRLSLDIEWMLQSDQVDDHTLITALVKNYYPRIYHGALSQLIYPEQAQRAAQDTFVQAIVESKSFRGNMPLSEWLDGIASRIFKERFSSLRGQQLLNPKLIQSIKLHKSDPLSSLELEIAIQGIEGKLHSRKTSGSRRITAQVFGLLGVISLVMLIMLGSRSFLSPDATTEVNSAEIESADTHRSSETVTGQHDTNQGTQPSTIEPLTLNSTADEIRERIMSGDRYWDTMWAEVVVTFHGPESYLGPQKREQHQFWIDPQHGGMLVSGPLDGFPDYIERFTIPAPMDDSWTSTWGEVYTQIGSQVPWFVLNLETVLNHPFVLNYLASSMMSEGIQTASYMPVGEQFWAGYRALIIDLISDSGIPVARVYLEPESGIILREQYYFSGSKRIFIESNIKDLKFNQPMPTMWKRPDNALLSPRMFLPGSLPEIEESSSWSHPELPHSVSGAIAPTNFDPSKSTLAFFKSVTSQGQEPGFERFEIYADNFRLGEIELPDPLQMICSRSPSGKRLAFAKWTYFPGKEANKIFWFDLDELQVTSLSFPDLVLHWIGFSPDERWLAVSGYSEADGYNQLKMIDTATGIVKPLPISASFNRITWSPDGKQILVLEEETGSSFVSDAERTISIYSASDGRLEDQIKVVDIPSDLNHLKVALDGWEAEFDLSLQDMDSCAAPPRN
jgi:hypothetical protein